MTDHNHHDTLAWRAYRADVACTRAAAAVALAPRQQPQHMSRRARKALARAAKRTARR